MKKLIATLLFFNLVLCTSVLAQNDNTTKEIKTNNKATEVNIFKIMDVSKQSLKPLNSLPLESLNETAKKLQDAYRVTIKY